MVNVCVACDEIVTVALGDTPMRTAGQVLCTWYGLVDSNVAANKADWSGQEMPGPAGPCGPWDPCGPCGPVGPVEPVWPVGPTREVPEVGQPEVVLGPYRVSFAVSR